MLDLVKLGGRVQGLRRARDLTLSGLAASAEVSVSMLSSVERGQKVPTILVLSRIADGLGVSLADLISEVEHTRVMVRRAAEQDTVDEPGGWRRTIVSPVVPGVNFEWIHTTLPGGCDAGEFPAYAPGSHEFVVVHTGTLRLTLGGRAVELGAGDSVYFAADTPHAYANPGTEPCSYHVAALIMRPRVARPLGTRPPFGGGPSGQGQGQRAGAARPAKRSPSQA